jgi:ABC-type spermidine/putrescine transport system permease subunit II
MSDGVPMSPILAWIRKWFYWAFLFCFLLVFVFPVLEVALFMTDYESVLEGRFSFLIPAIILADPRNRDILLSAVMMSFAACLGAKVLGTMLGYACAYSGGSLFRLFRYLALLPGRIPVWFVPAWFMVNALVFRDLPYSTENAGLVWGAWVAWWGATRIADLQARAIRGVSRDQWDAAATLSSHSVRATKIVSSPRISRDVQDEIRLIARTCLFDPTSILIFSADDWPIAEIQNIAYDISQVKLALAAGWILWLVLIWYTVCFVFRIVFRDRSRGQAVDSPGGRNESDGIDDLRFPSLAGYRVWVFPAALPMLTLPILAGLASVSNANGAGQILSAGSAEFERGFRTAFASSMTGITVILVATLVPLVISRFLDLKTILQRGRVSVTRWPIEASIVSVLIVSQFINLSVSGFDWRLRGIAVSTLAFAVYFTYAFASIPQVCFRKFRRGSEPISDEKKADEIAADCARTLGIPRSGTSAIVRRGRRASIAELPVSAFLLAGFWLWFSPAWAILPIRSMTPIPFGWQIAESMDSDFAAVAFLTGVSISAIALGLAGKLVEKLVSLRKQQSR